MIRDKDKIYGEVNDPNTILSSNTLTNNKYLVSAGGKNIKTFEPGAKRLLTVNSSGELSSLNYSVPNAFVVTDSSNNLQMFQKKFLPNEAPIGRVLIAEVKGSTLAGGNIGQSSLVLEAPYWYEIEVIGAGGGGGSGSILRKIYYESVHATNGGDGGYYKDLLPITTNTSAILQAGNTGQSSWGWSSKKEGKTIEVTGSGLGGTGGRTPILYSGKGGSQWQEGGLGINGGANGGTIYAPDGGSVGGGGANGPYGGKGGDSVSGAYYSGGGGGAGGGFGLGGDTGSKDPTWSSGIVTHQAGHGGGAGGHGTIFMDWQWDSAGGGGGGGGSRFKAGDFEVLCGGGGGGAGGFGFGGPTGYNTPGGHGRNNQNSDVGGGAKGGVGGISNNATSVDSEINTFGTGGEPGIVRVWRCV